MQFKQEYIEAIIAKAREYSAAKVILFGSALVQPDDCHDIDLACDMPGLNMFLFAGELEQTLNVPIDVVPITQGDPFIVSVQKYGKVIYEA